MAKVKETKAKVKGKRSKKVVRLVTGQEPIELAKSTPGVGKLLASKPATRGKPAQKRLVYYDNKGKLKASVDGESVKVVKTPVLVTRRKALVGKKLPRITPLPPRIS